MGIKCQPYVIPMSTLFWKRINIDNMKIKCSITKSAWYKLLNFNHYKKKFQHLPFGMNFFEFNHHQIYFYQPRLFDMHFFALQTSLACEGGPGIREHKLVPSMLIHFILCYILLTMYFRSPRLQ